MSRALNSTSELNTKSPDKKYTELLNKTVDYVSRVTKCCDGKVLRNQVIPSPSAWDHETVATEIILFDNGLEIVSKVL